MRDRIANFGLLLASVGLLSILVQLFGWELKVLRFLYDQGPATAWGVRIGLVVGGMVIFFAAHIGEKSSEVSVADQTLLLQGIAQDPHMTYLLRGLYQSTGATLAGPPGSARVANLFFMRQDGYGRAKAGAIAAIALIEGPQGRLQGTYMFATNQISVGPIDDATWSAYGSVC